MNNHHPSPLRSGECSSFKDLTNLPNHGNANPREQQPKRTRNWYAQMTNEQRMEYNKKRRLARAEKKAMASIVNGEQVSQTVCSHNQGQKKEEYNVMNRHPPALVERSPFRDLTNTPTQGIANPLGEALPDNIPKSAQNWYARMSDEKKAEYNQKRRDDRTEKKLANLISINHERVSQTHASSSLDVQRTPLTNITNTHINGVLCTAATSMSAEHRSKDCDTDWLHRNPIYQRQMIHPPHAFEESLTEGMHGQSSFLPGSISCRSVQMKDASSEKEKRRINMLPPLTIQAGCVDHAPS